MGYLVGVTALWAFSFSLIGVYLSGQVDSYFAVLMRVTLAMLVFLPFLRPSLLRGKQRLALMALGAIQLGVMYTFFYQSFLLLSVPEVLLFTIFTPVYIALLDDLMFGRFTPMYLITALLAVIGAAVIRYDGIDSGFWMGFLVVQGANLCFALGQVGYRRLAADLPPTLAWHNVFGWFFIGAMLVALPAYLLFGNSSALPTTSLQWGVLAWLGLMASGVGYFAWNQGATKVDAGTLAIMNNALIPAGLLINLLIWNRDADVPRLLIGALIMGASLWLNNWWLARRRRALA
ncbi:carboxylate/amino acid/amine transporter [Vreelandella songnenensis]|uniref:Carboxylate/amino acid/amine transporter n=1 Tax=Vreelandella songnenensis TaxID=1176243 RepID=A0A2T0UUV7_9GAMM|nr:carboxylate/amino acid/amine transporter [Halomonas songnenensis]PRY61638.1 carboxylate/amino acid/amine transporter [Halomonas songnenensis]